MSDNYNNNDDREAVCSVCHRSESRAGKMLKLPGGAGCFCVDCLQKTMDNFDFSGMPFTGMPFGMPSQNSTSGGASAETEDKTPIEGEVLDADQIEELEKEGAPKEEEKKTPPPKKKVSGPTISFINMADFQNAMGKRSQIKKKKPEERTEPLIDPDKILPPHKLKEKLDEYVIGQEKAKKIISVAVYNHYKRVLAGERAQGDDVEIEKSNILMVGPTGSGKTHIVKTLAKLLDVPLAITDATTLTEAGYIGDDIESVLSKLLQAADNDVDRAEIGIVFIDEIDKIAKKNSVRGRDVSGESVQQGLLKLLEGSEVEVPVGATSKNAMVPLTTINTKNILFICGGAFPELDDIIKERLMEKTSIGFMADLKDKYDNDKDLLSKVETEDLRKYGMIPEFLGRLPIVCTLQELTGDMLVRVLNEPKNAILKQYKKLLELDEVCLEFEDDALLAITEKALKKEMGARGLRAVIEDIMTDIMYEIPKDDSIGKVIITRDFIENNGAPIIEIRSSERTSRQAALPENAGVTS